jgi:septal ring factor EnvC (AmiA/AmiB activator)
MRSIVGGTASIDSPKAVTDIFHLRADAQLLVRYGAIIMEAMRESWTDERLDDFREETARRFEEARTETARRFDEVDRRIDRIDDDIRELRGAVAHIGVRIDEMNRTILRLGTGSLITFVVGFAGLIATQL